MLVWVEQDLNRLPTHEANGQQRRNAGRFEGVRRRLQTVEATEFLIDERERAVRCLEEQGVIVTARLPVERCQLCRRQVWPRVRWFKVGGLYRSVLGLALRQGTNHDVHTMTCAIPRHSCSSNGVGLLSGLIRLLQ